MTYIAMGMGLVIGAFLGYVVLAFIVSIIGAIFGIFKRS